jgi:glucokinase
VILAGDVGGTKCNLALFAEKGGRLAPIAQERFPSKNYARFDDLVVEFLRQTAPHIAGDGIASAGFGVAGPVVHDRVKATNLPWIVDGPALAQKLGVARVVLLNDLGATAHSVEYLAPEDLFVLNKDTPEPGAAKAVIAAGTGLGEAILFWDGTCYRVAPTEGGHADFAPNTEQQIELWRFLRKRSPHVSWELILSGRGFKTLHEFLAPAVRHPSFDDLGADPAPEITRLGLEKSCPVCVATLDLWTAIYGSEAGNLAMRVLALGGVYVAGGIAVKLLEKLKDGAFLRSFCDKEAFGSLLQKIPIAVILNESAPLLGAAYQALAAVRR